MILRRVAADVGERKHDHREARRGRFFGRRGRRGLRLRDLIDLERIGADRFGNVPELFRAEIDDGEIEPPFDLPIGVLGQTDCARLANALQSRGDVDAIAHQVAVGLLDHVAEMDADAEIDAAVVRHPNIAVDEAILHRYGAAHGLDHAAELDEATVASALHHPAVVDGDGRVDQLTTQRAQPRQSSVLVRAREPTIADDIRHQDRSNLPDFGHGATFTRSAE
jgi:hypothetical protein